MNKIYAMLGFKPKKVAVKPVEKAAKPKAKKKAQKRKA